MLEVNKMQPPVHFLLSIVACLGVGLHLESKFRRYLIIVVAAISAACIDLDHLLPLYHESNIAIFHNVFVFIFLPAMIFWMFFFLEQKKYTSLCQRIGLLFCVSFTGHMLLDCIQGGSLPLFFPASSGHCTISNIGITINPAVFSLSSDQMIIIIWGAIIFGANKLESLIYNDIEGSGYLLQTTVKNADEAKVQKNRTFLVKSSGFYFTGIHLFSQLKAKRTQKENTKS